MNNAESTKNATSSEVSKNTTEAGFHGNFNLKLGGYPIVYPSLIYPFYPTYYPLYPRIYGGLGRGGIY